MTKNYVHGDEAVLDLVAHFLGLATHDNVNGPPSDVTRLAELRARPPLQSAPAGCDEAVEHIGPVPVRKDR